MNPTYLEGNIVPQFVAITDMEHGPTLGYGVRTITHNRRGLKLDPHKVVVIEMVDGENIISFDLQSSYAREVANRLLEYANQAETKS